MSVDFKLGHPTLIRPENAFAAAPQTCLQVEQDQMQEEREPSTLILFWLCCVSALEGMDTQLVPACQFALQRDLGLQLGHFAVLFTVQMVLTNLAAPFWGILADRGTLKRKTILMLGAIGEGVAITIFAFVPNFWVMMFLRGMSGFFLASLRPVCNGLIADLTSDNKRGKIFGRVQSALLVGMFCSLLIAGNVANPYVGNIPGWRFLFAGGGVVAFIVALGLGGFLTEPPHQLDESAKVKGCAAVRTELCTVLSFLRIPTFCVMIMQGVFGTIPWSVMGNNLLFFKFCGLEDWQASILAAEGTVAGVFGNSIGGMIADALARRFGYHGRPLSAQITVAIGIPMVFLQFYGIPPGEGTFGVYFALIAVFGLLGSWAQSGTNFPSSLTSCRPATVARSWHGSVPWRIPWPMPLAPPWFPAWPLLLATSSVPRNCRDSPCLQPEPWGRRGYHRCSRNPGLFGIFVCFANKRYKRSQIVGGIV